MGDVHHCSRARVSEMAYTVSSGTLNSTIPYHTYQPVSYRFVYKLRFRWAACVLFIVYLRCFQRKAISVFYVAFD